VSFFNSNSLPTDSVWIKGQNGYILSLEDKQLFQHDSFMKSADFQLAEVFQSPGFKMNILLGLC
jgi:hypothetical protein